MDSRWNRAWGMSCKLFLAGVLLIPATSWANAWNFTFQIQGLGDVTSNVESIEVDDLVVNNREMTTGADWDYRVSGPGDRSSGNGSPWADALTGALFEEAVKEGWRVSGPGDAHFGSITIRGKAGRGADGQTARALYEWWLDTSQGKNIRKRISVIALKPDGSEARSWNLLACSPTRWDPGEYSPSSRVTPPRPGDTFSMVLEYGGLEMDAAAPRGDEGDSTEAGKFKIEIAGASNSGRAGNDVDSAWETCSGGALQVYDSSHFNGLPFYVPTRGDKAVEVFRARSPLSGGRKALCEWITAASKGQPWKRTVTVKEILKDGSDGKTFSYFECYPTRYVFPAFSASGTGNLYEEVHIKPIRLDLG